MPCKLKSVIIFLPIISNFIYSSLFMSFLQHSIVVWGQTFSSYIEPLFKLQKKAIRNISHLTALSHSLPLFKGLHCLEYQMFSNLNS